MTDKELADLLKRRFLEYVSYDTQSNPDSETYPSTKKQLLLLELLKNQLNEMGLKDVKLDDYGYVTATLPSNSKKDIPTIAFIAHVDTATEVTGANVNPQVIKNYQGGDIQLPNDANQVIKEDENPYLKELIGHDIVTTDGTTLLGADDKSGVAIIIAAIKYLLENPTIKHGEIKILFNPDEEVGQGTKHFDVESFGAEFGYTLDSSKKGEIAYENFNAHGAKVKFMGKAIHPGYAKDKLINAIKVASYFVTLLPNDLSPECTDSYNGFVHPVEMSTGNEDAIVKFIIRDFDAEKMISHRELIEGLAKQAAEKYSARYEVEFEEQYQNMNEIIKKDPRVVDFAKEAMERLGIKPISSPIRGGTDGATLTHNGLPCPNLFTGMQNYHGKLEYISVQDMIASVKTVVEICKVWEENAS